jgi:hypothetical protein
LTRFADNRVISVVSAKSKRNIIASRAAAQARASLTPEVKEQSKPRPKIIFSGASNASDVPDCYRVYRQWTAELEKDLWQVCLLLRFTPAQVNKFGKAAYERSQAGVFRNPSQLRARISKLQQLEARYPGLSVAVVVSQQPLLLAFRPSHIATKLAKLAEMGCFASGGADVGTAVNKCPSILTRSVSGVQGVNALLVRVLGVDVAGKVTALYPEIFSRSQDRIQEAWEGLVEVFGSEAVAQKVLLKNPALIVRTDLREKVDRLAAEIGLPLESVRPARVV